MPCQDSDPEERGGLLGIAPIKVGSDSDDSEDFKDVVSTPVYGEIMFIVPINCTNNFGSVMLKKKHGVHSVSHSFTVRCLAFLESFPKRHFLFCLCSLFSFICFFWQYELWPGAESRGRAKCHQRHTDFCCFGGLSQPCHSSGWIMNGRKKRGGKMKLVTMSVSLANQKIYIKNTPIHCLWCLCSVVQLQNKQTNQKSKKATLMGQKKTTCKFWEQMPFWNSKWTAVTSRLWKT